MAMNMDRIKKNDIVKRIKKHNAEERGTTDNVSIEELCWLLRQNGLSHSHGYFHYTTLDRLEGMLEKVDVGEAEKKRLFWLSASTEMNDTQDNCKGVYVASFSYGEEEEVAMWTNYGVPKVKAVRIKFPLRAMMQWAKRNTAKDIKVYVPDGEKTYRALGISPVEVYFADVAYYGRNKTAEDERREGVRYLGCGFGLKEAKWRDSIKNKNDALLFKKRGWAYEKEVRLVVRFKDASITAKHKAIALPFDALYDAMLSNVRQNIVLGPWQNGSLPVSIDGIENAGRSVFDGELRMRSNCDKCKHNKNQKKCSCPYAEWKIAKEECK